MKFKYLCSLLLVLTIIISPLISLPASAQDTDSVNCDEMVQPHNEEGACCCGVIEEPEPDVYSSQDYPSKKELAELSLYEFPPSVDNSASEYFPEILNQGSLNSCGAVSIVYYMFTYELNKARGVKTTSDNTLSPKFVYNLINGGLNKAVYTDDLYNIIETIGCPTNKNFPYDKTDLLSWSCDEEIWYEAMSNRITGYHNLAPSLGTFSTLISSTDDTDLQQLKQKLSEGKILRFTTHTSTWKLCKLTTNENVPENDKYQGEVCVKYVTNSDGYAHSMLIVGYNDNIWCDINENGNVDKGEMGAFKVVDSYGKGKYNDGFAWVAYDALNIASQVDGAEIRYDRNRALRSIQYIDVIGSTRSEEIYVKFTLNTADRSQFAVSFFSFATIKSNSFLSNVDYKLDSNKYAFDGSKVATDATFIYPLTNLVPWVDNDRFVPSDYIINISDSEKDGVPLIIKDISVVNEYTGKEYKVVDVFPKVIDGETYTASLEEPFGISTITQDKPNGVVTKPIVFESTTVSEKINVETYGKPTTRYVVKNSNGQVVCDEVVECLNYNVVGKTSTTRFEFTPTKSGEYTLTVSSTDDSNFYDEKTISFSVVDMILGDADGNGTVNVIDSTLIQKYTANYITKDKLHEEMADCNEDAWVNIMDATYIQHYIANTGKYGKVGEVIDFVSQKSTITFTDAVNWGGEIYCYYRSNENFLNWPGERMTKIGVNDKGESIYSITIPKDVTQIIFNIGFAETSAVYYTGGDKNYYPIDNGTGNFYNVIEI